MVQATNLSGSLQVIAAFCHYAGLGVPQNEGACLDLLGEAQDAIQPMNLVRELMRYNFDSRGQPSTLVQELDQIGHLDSDSPSHLYLQQNKLEEAEKCLVREIRDLETLASWDNVYLYELRRSLAQVYDIHRRFDEEEQLVLRILEVDKARINTKGVWKG